MYCKKCGSEIKIKGFKVPEQCYVCGAKFRIKSNLGVIICGVITMAFVLVIYLILKKIILNKNILYVVLMMCMIVIFNIIENVLLKMGIIQYNNLIV